MPLDSEMYSLFIYTNTILEKYKLEVVSQQLAMFVSFSSMEIQLPQL